MKTEECSYENAQTYISNLYFLPNSKTEESQLNNLIRIRERLDKLGLIERNEYFSLQYRNLNALVVGYGKDLEIESIANELGIVINYPKSESRLQGTPVYEFSSMESEIHYVFNLIAHRIKKNSSIEDIYLFDPSSTYNYTLTRASRYFNIPINFPSNQVLSNSPIGIAAIKHFTQNNDLALLKKYLIDSFSLNDEDKIFDLIKQVESSSNTFEPQLDYLSYLLKRTKIPQIKYKNAIQILNFPVAPVKGIVFVLGFIQGVIPQVFKDVDFLSDRIKDKIRINTSLLSNQSSSKEIVLFLNSCPEVVFSYSKVSLDSENYISPLADTLGLIKIVNPPIKNEYGNLFGKLYLAHLMDEKRIYGLINPLENTYLKYFPIPYRSYRYEFTPVVTGLENDKLKLSYSRLKAFYACQFYYYLENILKIDPFEGTFYTSFGSLAHSVLQDSNLLNFDFQESVKKHLLDYEFSAKDKVILKNLIIDLEKVINFNLRHQSKMDLKEIFTEVNTTFELDDKTVFNGIIDKILITNFEKQTLAAIIDYKSGMEKFDPLLIPYGLSMQLPLYSVLLSKNPDFSNVEVIGFYIQSITPKKRFFLPGTIEEKRYFNQFKLNGLSTDNISKLATLDKDFSSSEFIASISMTVKGDLSSRAKVSSFEEFVAYRDACEEKIYQALKEIRKSNFVINPHLIVKKDYSCEYCVFQDVCFRPDSAVKIIKLTKDNDDFDEVSDE
jgi:ATP-dependent helicase/DNAse subunit B